MALLPDAGANDPTASPGLTSGGGILDTALNIVDPSGIRKQIAGLLDGGISSLFNKSTPPGISTQFFPNSPTNPTNLYNNDWRVKIGLPAGSSLFYKDQNNQLMEILKRTNGVVFPYTPSVTVTHNARYQEQALTHSNYKNYFYEGSDVSAITITGDFAVQNRDDGLYLLAAIYYFRSCTKMFFGANDSLAGNPPPIVFLDGYGELYFPHVSCVVTSFQHTMPADVDYVEIPYTDQSSTNGNTQLVRLPTTSQLTVTVQPIYSRRNVHNNMSLTAFSQGKLLSGNGGFL